MRRELGSGRGLRLGCELRARLADVHPALSLCFSAPGALVVLIP